MPESLKVSNPLTMGALKIPESCQPKLKSSSATLHPALQILPLGDRRSFPGYPRLSLGSGFQQALLTNAKLTLAEEGSFGSRYLAFLLDQASSCEALKL